MGGKAAMAQRSTPSVRSDINEVLAAAKASRARDKGFTSMVKDAQQEGYVRDMETFTIKEAQAWLQKLKVRKNMEGKLVANAEQFAAVKLVVNRVIREIEYLTEQRESPGEPLRWLVHGGPGTGKSHVIKLIKHFFPRRHEI